MKNLKWILVLILFSSVSFSKTKVHTTKLKFDDELIRGDVSSSDLLLILKGKNPNYGKLLKLRDHFLPELRSTRYEVLRSSK